MRSMSQPMAVRLAPHVDRRVRELAETEGNTPSAVLRRAIHLGLSQLDRQRDQSVTTDSTGRPPAA
jgi:predicted transcriptional regulator